MNQPDSITDKDLQLEAICRFIENTQGLKLRREGELLEISQDTDGKLLKLTEDLLSEVIVRQDSDGQDFLQVNYTTGHKILLTDKLVGFKPVMRAGLDMGKLPKVVTTPDLISVVEAIDDSVNSPAGPTEEVDVLRRVFDSVLLGGEAVGFDLSEEKAWLGRLASVKNKASA